MERNFSVNVPISLHTKFSRGKRLARTNLLGESTLNMAASDIPSTNSINNNMQMDEQLLKLSKNYQKY
jgi:hypothetical protein